jgi:hypothetical protein
MIEYSKELAWCGGFFDGEGSFSFATECPIINLVNTNPLAVTKFFEIMKRYDINWKITERSKPSKSSKKKRWDLYIITKSEVIKFLNVMENYIYGKKKQLYLMKNFYDEIKNKQSKDILKDYHQIMMYYNQSSNILIVDENKLFEKLGFKLDFKHHEIANEENIKIETNSFNDLYYLAGIMDAEGTFYINKRNVNNSYDRFIPFVSFVNTNKEIVKHCCSTLKNNNIGYHVQNRTAENRNRVRWDVSISGVSRTVKINELIKDKLIIKNRQSELMLKYSQLRLNDIMGKNEFGDSFKESIEVLNKEN